MGQLELANLLAGLLPVNQGKIFLDGKDVTGNTGLNMIREGVAYVPGGPDPRQLRSRISQYQSKHDFNPILVASC